MFFNIKQTISYYLFLKYKYKFNSLFKKQRKAVVNFKGLQNIDFKEKIILEKREEGFSYKPNENIKLSTGVPVIFQECIAYNLINCDINSQSSSVLMKRKDTLYYEKFDDDNGFKYYSNFIRINIKEMARIDLYREDFSIKSAIFLGGTFIFNYYHFLIEIIPKLKYLDKLPDKTKNLPILIDNCVNKTPSFIDILNIFAPNREIIFIDFKKLYYVENLWYLTNPNTSPFDVHDNTKIMAYDTKTRPSTIEYLRNTVLAINKFENIKRTIPRIFISRKSKIRKASNHAEIFEIARKYNFEEVFFEDFTFRDQVFLMRNVDYIIGSTGAAWTNLIFAKKNAKGLIWMSDIWGNLSVFSNLAKIVGFDLKYLIFENDFKNDYHADYNLDLQLFENKLIEILNI